MRDALTFDSIRTLPMDEVAAYFVTRRAEGLTRGEQLLLETWLSKGDAHRLALDGADRAWNCLDGAEDDEILAAMRAHALAAGPAPAAFGWKHLAAVAAVLVVAVGAALRIAPMLNTAPRPGTQPVIARAAIASAPISYASATGEVKDITLPDGSRMTLDADSTAIGRFGAGGRTMQLVRGRAFFAVVHDASHPFTVLAADRRLVDIGTSFDVNIGPQTLTVTLLEGRLGVGTPGQTAVTATLAPGQQLVRQQGQDQIRSLDGEAEDAIAWRTGSIRFDNQTLAEAAAIMNRYSRDQIVIRDPGVAAMQVTGQFRAGQTEEFAETLTELYHLRSSRTASQIELLPPG